MTCWRKALRELIHSGCSVRIVDKNICIRWRRKKHPLPDEKFSFLIEVLRENKEEILKNPTFLIDQAFIEISKTLWKPGLLNYLKFSRPGIWKRLLELENEINQHALNNDLSSLKKALDKYKNLINKAGREFGVSDRQREVSFKEA